MIIQAVNNTGGTLTYNALGISIPSGNTVTIQNAILNSFVSDPNVEADIRSDNLYLTDSVTSYHGDFAFAFLTDVTKILNLFDKNSTGTITALNGDVSILTNGSSTVYVNITGTWVATLIFEGQNGDGNWNNIVGVAPAGGILNALAGNASVFIPVGGCTQFRVRASAFTSGTATVTLNASSGTQATQVFNFSAGSLNAKAQLQDNSANGITSTTVSGKQRLDVGLSSEGLDGSAAPTNSIQMGGKDGSNNLQSILVDTAGNVAVLVKDSSANGITSSLGTTKRGIDVTINPMGANYYAAPVNIRQTATTAANATVWAMRNASGSTKTVYIEKIDLQMDFDVATPITRQTLRYMLQRFSTATPTGGSAITVIEMDNANASTQVTDVRFLDTGLTTTSVVFENPFAIVSRAAVDASGCTLYKREGIPLVLAAGEGFCIRLNQAALVGQGLYGEVVWSER